MSFLATAISSSHSSDSNGASEHIVDAQFRQTYNDRRPACEGVMHGVTAQQFSPEKVCVKS